MKVILDCQDYRSEVMQCFHMKGYPLVVKTAVRAQPEGLAQPVPVPFSLRTPARPAQPLEPIQNELLADKLREGEESMSRLTEALRTQESTYQP